MSNPADRWKKNCWQEILRLHLQFSEHGMTLLAYIVRRNRTKTILAITQKMQNRQLRRSEPPNRASFDHRSPKYMTGKLYVSVNYCNTANRGVAPKFMNLRIIVQKRHIFFKMPKWARDVRGNAHTSGPAHVTPLGAGRTENICHRSLEQRNNMYRTILHKNIELQIPRTQKNTRVSRKARLC